MNRSDWKFRYLKLKMKILMWINNTWYNNVGVSFTFKRTVYKIQFLWIEIARLLRLLDTFELHKSEIQLIKDLRLRNRLIVVSEDILFTKKLQRETLGFVEEWISRKKTPEELEKDLSRIEKITSLIKEEISLVEEIKNTWLEILSQDLLIFIKDVESKLSKFKDETSSTLTAIYSFRRFFARKFYYEWILFGFEELKESFYSVIKVLTNVTDVVVYKPYYYLYKISHILLKTTFVKGEKWVFNKKHLLDKSLPRFIKGSSSVVTVPGFTVKTRYTVFIDRNIQLKSKIFYHKYDFSNEIDVIEKFIDEQQTEFYKIQCSLWTVFNLKIEENQDKIFEKISRCIDLVHKNVSSIESVYAKKFLAVEAIALKDVFVKNNYNFDMFLFENSLFETISGMNSIYNSLISIKDSLQSINIQKGYILSTNIFDDSIYPIVADVVKVLISEEEFNKLNNYFKSSCYKWLINIIILNFYTVCNKCLARLSLIDVKTLTMNEANLHLEMLSRMRVLSNWCYSMLDNSIKQHMIKRNITINSEVITGFDTEYVPIDWGKNELLSAQLSFSHVLKLSIPLFSEFDFEGVNTLTSETYIKALPKFKEVDLIRSFITEKILENRIYKFGEHDKIMNKVGNYFNNCSNIKNVAVNSRNMIVLLNKSVIQNLFILPVEGEVLKLNFGTIIHLIKTHTCDRDVVETRLFDYIKYLDWDSLSDESLDLVVERIEDSWDIKSLKQSDIQRIYLSNEDNKSFSKLEESSKSCAEIRKFFCVKEGRFFEEDLVQFPNAEALALDQDQDQGANAPFGSGSGGSENSLVVGEETRTKTKSPSPALSPATSVAPLIKGELGGWPPRSVASTKILINIRRKIFLAAHYNAADFTLLEDWRSVSFKNVDIVKKCYTSLSKAIKYDGKEKVFLRDTMLLVSATAKSLDAVAYAYGMKKVELSQYYKENMHILLQENINLFEEYAMNDSLITLIHMLFINDFSFKLGNLNIPNTLGTLSSRYIKNKWREDSYRGYQIDVNYPLGDVRQSHTPKGIQFGSSTLEFSNLYIGSYRGGRNECFKYGIDKSTKWYDYDLTSCYSTIMSMMGQPEYERTESQRLAEVSESILSIMGQPDYNKGTWIHPGTDVSKLNIKESYSAFKIKFCLPKAIAYPPFPVTLDESITVYPSSGVTLVTGLEYLTGLKILNDTIGRLNLQDSNEFYIEILYGAFIPYKKDLVDSVDEAGMPKKEEVLSYSPFFEVINELQEKRRQAKKATGKGSAMERIYKDLGNMLYGKIVCGISNKKVYDARADEMKTMIGNDLSNPILGSWITGYVRSLIAELLYKVDLLGGKVASCTTDGFVTDIHDLENKICQNFDISDSLLEEYRNIRTKLSGENLALEVKTNVNGLIQWTTRGQLSIDHSETDVPITAATGYQKSKLHQENVELVQEALVNGNKVLFLQKHLTGALDIYKSKGKVSKHVSMTSQQRTFRTIFDSKRFVIESQESMLSTRPFDDVSEALLQRKLMMELKQSVYSDEYSVFTVPPSKNCINETVKLFLRMVSHLYNYKIPNSMKFNICSILSKIDSSIKTEYLIDLMSYYETEKGNVVSKLPIFRKSSDFVLALYKELSALAETNEMYKDILDVFLVYFDNFSCLPRNPEDIKQDFILKIKNIDAKRLVFIENEGEILIKILKEEEEE